MSNETAWKILAIALILLVAFATVSYLFYDYGKQTSQKEIANYQSKTGNVLLINNETLFEIHINTLCQNIINQQIAKEQG